MWYKMSDPYARIQSINLRKGNKVFIPSKLEHITKRLADDLVEMHNATAIELEYWETARLLVEQYYDVHTKVMIGAKK